MPDLERESRTKKGAAKGDRDPLVDPDGLYSGALKRLAISDGKFCAVQGMPPDSRKSGRLKVNNYS